MTRTRRNRLRWWVAFKILPREYLNYWAPEAVIRHVDQATADYEGIAAAQDKRLGIARQQIRELGGTPNW